MAFWRDAPNHWICVCVCVSQFEVGASEPLDFGWFWVLPPLLGWCRNANDDCNLNSCVCVHHFILYFMFHICSLEFGCPPFYFLFLPVPLPLVKYHPVMRYLCMCTIKRYPETKTKYKTSIPIVVGRKVFLSSICPPNAFSPTVLPLVTNLGGSLVKWSSIGNVVVRHWVEISTGRNPNDHL